MTRELLIGCGHSRLRHINPNPPNEVGERRLGIGVWGGLITLDNNPNCNPDFLCDLTQLFLDCVDGETRSRPCFHEYRSVVSPETYTELCEPNHTFRTSVFDEIHAYEVLEHIGAQGDYRTLFAQFGEFWRMLKPNGYLCATVPDWRSVWAWGDPGHTRVISPATLVFLDPEEYAKQLGQTAMSDYRDVLGPTHFRKVRTAQPNGGSTFAFTLQAIK